MKHAEVPQDNKPNYIASGRSLFIYLFLAFRGIYGSWNTDIFVDA